MDSTSPPTPPTTLIVEDDAQSREATARALTRAGYEAIAATSREEALHLMAAVEFDGLYCAIELPGAGSAPESIPEKMTVAWIKPASGFVHLS